VQVWAGALQGLLLDWIDILWQVKDFVRYQATRLTAWNAAHLSWATPQIFMSHPLKAGRV
jgi:hypothetical protein